MVPSLQGQFGHDFHELNEQSSPSIVSLDDISDLEFSRLSELGTDDLATIMTSDAESSDSDWPIQVSPIMKYPRHWPKRTAKRPLSSSSRPAQSNVSSLPNTCCATLTKF